MSGEINAEFWRGKRVFVSGHSGFKGSWLCLWLQSLGAEVKGYALAPSTDPSMFLEAAVDQGMSSELGDVCDFASLSNSMRSFSPEIVFHMAAQPLVRQSYQDPVQTYTTNVLGTVNLLEATRQCPDASAVVNVTTDKCYENREWVWAYRENDELGGWDPYSSSKSCSELVTFAYRSSFFYSAEAAGVASARAGNVIGGGDWTDSRLIPDILRAFDAGVPAVIRNPHAIRPWQHVLEPLSGYLLLAERLASGGQAWSEAWNFGPDYEDAQSVRQIADQLANLWGEKAVWQVDESQQVHEAQTLRLDSSKARSRLSWAPRWSLRESLEKTVEWHRCWKEGGDVKEASLAQIFSFMNAGN